ncbi:MAG TPA: DUF4238 domain-containing protein [Prolixibacteraceae bacterium]|nr:DUF4238 domain-containing protein [Prolixibacteraceae bacterium]
MSNKKNQHFVPQFYLRRFSKTMKSPYLELFNCSSQKHIPTASIKNQASIKHFYDNDDSIENLLGKIENEAAKSISKIDNSLSLPSSSIDRINLLAFTFYQLTRTKSHADEVQSTINNMYQQIYKDDPRFKGIFDEHKIGIDRPATFAIGIISKIIHQTFDLKIKLIINKTNQNFITSDNPVLKYNQFLERRKHFGGITGIGLKGIQYFLPIDSKKCLLFYDSKTYNIGKWFSNRVIITKQKEIDLINLLQFLNCEDKIYFNDETEIEYIKRLNQESKKFQKAGISIVKEYKQEEIPDVKNSTLLHSFSTDLKIGLELSFIRENRKAKNYKMGNKFIHLRNKKLDENINNYNRTRLPV